MIESVRFAEDDLMARWFARVLVSRSNARCDRLASDQIENELSPELFFFDHS